MSGTDIRLGRLFDADSGRALITAYDHGLSLPMPPAAGTPLELLAKIVEGGPEGVLINPGMLRQGAGLFARRGAATPVLRCDWTLLDEGDKEELGERYRVLTTPTEALELGAGAICMFLVGRPTDGGMFADNVRALARAAHEARKVGIPLIVEPTLWGLRNKDRKDPELLKQMCRIAVEVGADVIKTEYVGTRTAELIDACLGVPVLTLGGAKGDAGAVADAARGAIAAGASGLIFGRNIWAADDPVAVTPDLLDIVHGGDR